MRQSPKVVTKQELMMELWGDEEPESDALRSHIYNLRKMVDKPFDPKLLHTVAGVGLKLLWKIPRLNLNRPQQLSLWLAPN